ncbi:hypothetical protein [Sphingomonas hengshuiensis]|uniref:Uncharacterized protein n=1 Tax=Sphingomonas hengshuiensis TaxID=1609977 RepID=A0A7U4J7R6_9SPHN|nr:hypothetical protein [Sphingomonas hengshuiensis]AJP71822.1 hypothetical protein TS85_08555 [Sphingomonas hengshuiensis]
MLSEKPRFIELMAINGEPMLVNLASVRSVSAINLAGAEMGVIVFDKDHEVVVGSTVAQVIKAIAGPPIMMGD